MSNVKLVIVRGTMTFDASNADGKTIGSNQRVLTLLGQLALPTFGLKIRFGNKATMVPNCHGGKTAMFSYEITGKEAVSNGSIKLMIQDLKQVGDVVAATVMDIENEAPAEDLLAV